MDFKKYYNFPLECNYDFSIKVFTADHSMAFDFIMPLFLKTRFPNGAVIRKEDRFKIVNCVNGEGAPPKEGLELKYDPDNSTILVKDKEGNYRELIIVRGWGNLTGTGGHNLPDEEAIKIQTEFANYIIKKLRNEDV